MKDEKQDHSSLIKNLYTTLNKDEICSDLIGMTSVISYDRLNVGIDDRLMRKLRRTIENYGIYRRSLAYTPADYEIIFCDENDLSGDDKQKLILENQRSKMVFLIMICPDVIMNEEHDVSGIPDIIEVKKSMSGFPVGVSVEKKVVKNINQYLTLIKEYADINDKKDEIQARINVLKELLFELSKDDDDMWWGMYKGWHAHGIRKSIESLEKYNKRCEHLLGIIKAEYSEYSSDCKNEIAEEKFQKENVGDVAADLLFKYNGVQNLIKEELITLSRSTCMKDEFFTLTVNECLRIIDKKPEVSFVGNFSSGKTSVINWLLAMEGNEQLRTSGLHNTAILTLIKKGVSESVLLEYKKKPEKFHWNLLKVEFASEFADIYHGENNATVIKVDEENRVIIYRYKNAVKTIPLQNRVDSILVKKNDILKKGMFLTEGSKSQIDIPRDNATITLCEDKEYREIVKAIKQKKLKSSCISISYIERKSLKNRSVSSINYEITDENDVLSFINRLRSLGNRFEVVNIPLREVERIGFWKTDGVTYLPNDIEYIYNVLIEGECDFKDKQEKLTKSTWKKYCGTGKNGEDVYTETPEGYLFTEQITYFLDKGFLNFSDIIDTPGLGSISDEHDDITERHIRKNVGNLLVMLKIDKNGAAISRRRFIYEIAKIYEDSGRDKNNVFFVCNLWSKDYGREVLSELERLCDRYYKVIKECGFNKNNFYVIDIKKMQKGHHEQSMFNKYNSDEVFKKKFIKHIADKGVRYQIKKINEDICNLFDERINKYTQSINLLHEDASKKAERKERILLGKTTIERIGISDSFETLFEKGNYALDELQSLSREISSFTSKKEWINFSEECLKQQSYLAGGLPMDEISMIEMNCKDDGEENQYKDNIIDTFTYVLTKMESCLLNDLGHNEYNPIIIRINDAIEGAKRKRIGMGGFPFNDLRNRIVKQKQHFKSMIHFIHNANISKSDANEISSYINEQIKKCKKENKENYNNIKKVFDEIKEAVLNDIKNQLEDISSSDDTDSIVMEYSNYLTGLEELQHRWKKKISNVEAIKEIAI